MTSAALLSERAVSLARSDSSDADAIAELLRYAEGQRVSVILARRRLEGDADAVGGPGGETARAVSLLQAAIDQMPV